MTDDQSGIYERVREAVLSLSRPATAAEVARLAGAARAPVEACLRGMADDGALATDDRPAGTVYFPDPVTAYVEGVRAVVEGVPGSTPPEFDGAALAEARRAVADWRDLSTVHSEADADRYRLGGQVVAASRLPVGAHVYDDEWDVLVVLDACRVDALRTVAGDLGVDAGDVRRRVSLGSQTAEWLCQTFTTDRAETVAETGYVSGNGLTAGVFADRLLPEAFQFGASLPTRWDPVEADAFAVTVDAWRAGPGEYSRDAPWDPHPSPRTVTDHAVGAAREYDPGRLVVHYKQPHEPYTERARREGRQRLAPPEGNMRAYIQQGGDPEAVWDAYLTDLRAALAEVRALCRNVDGRVAVTADHGEAFGEGGEVGHRLAMLHPRVKTVPWVTLDASDEHTREGTLDAADTDRRDVADHLDALGYL